MIYAIPNAEYERLESLGELSAIQREIASADEASLTKRLALGIWCRRVTLIAIQLESVIAATAVAMRSHHSTGEKSASAILCT